MNLLYKSINERIRITHSMWSRKHLVLLLFSLTFWLASSVVCFCCFDQKDCFPLKEKFEESQGKSSDKESDGPQDSFPFCCQCSCGAQTFTSIEDKVIWKEDLPSLALKPAHPIFVEQIHPNAIYHPPEA